LIDRVIHGERLVFNQVSTYQFQQATESWL